MERAADQSRHWQDAFSQALSKQNSAEPSSAVKTDQQEVAAALEKLLRLACDRKLLSEQAWDKLVYICPALEVNIVAVFCHAARTF